MTHYVDFYDPIDSKIFKLSPEQVKILLVYLLYKLNNLTTKTFEIKYGGKLNYTINKDTALSSTWYKSKNSKILDYILKDKDSPDYIYNKDDLTDYINSVILIYKKIWTLMSNVVDNTAKTDIMTLTDFIFTPYIEEYNIDTLERKLKSYEYDSLLNEKTHDIIFENLIYSIVDIEYNSLKELIENYKKVINIFDKNTSYTVQLLMDINHAKTYVANSGHNNINLGYKSYLEVKDAMFTTIDIVGDQIYPITNLYQRNDNEITYIDKNITQSFPTGNMPILWRDDTINDEVGIYGYISKVYPLN